MKDILLPIIQQHQPITRPELRRLLNGISQPLLWRYVAALEDEGLIVVGGNGKPVWLTIQGSDYLYKRSRKRVKG